MYYLVKEISVAGYGKVYKQIYTSCELEDVANELKMKVKDGYPLHSLKIVKGMDFVYTCDVSFGKKTDEEAN